MEELKNKLPEIYEIVVKANFNSLKSILLKNETDLQQCTKLSSNNVNLLLETISEIYFENKLKNAYEIRAWTKLSSGCRGINDILNGGIPINGINEIYGESGVGKTQFCLQLALMAQLPKMLGGLGKNVIYICTEDPFPSKRLKQLEETFLNRFENGTEINIVFGDNIFVEHIPDFEQLKICLYLRLEKLIEQKNVGVIIIDSIAGAFRSYNENTNYQHRSENFFVISRKLNEFCSKYDVGIVCTNQVSDNLLTGESDPCLGISWSNLITSRFCISRSFNRSLRKFKVVFAPHLQTVSCNFNITESGIVDY